MPSSSSLRVEPSSWTAFGRVISTDIALPGLPSAVDDGCPSVAIRGSGDELPAATRAGSARRRFVREPYAGGVRYFASDVGEFVIAAGGHRLTYSLARHAKQRDVEYVLAGPALVMALQLQGEFFLHAGAVGHQGAMFALSAPHGFGKSTLTASFHSAGHAIHSDDVVPIREREGSFVGGQGQPWIKLWDNVLGEFGEDPERFDEVLDGLGKRLVPGITAEGELPLRIVYVLAPHTHEESPIAFRELSHLEGALALMANAYSPEIMEGELAARNLDFATRIAAQVPVRVVSYYRSFETLPHIRDAILRDFEEVTDA